MKIRSITTTVVEVPVKRVGKLTRAWRTHAVQTVVQMMCIDSIVGLGEDGAEILTCTTPQTLIVR